MAPMPLLNTLFRERLLSSTIAVLDVETTGFKPGWDRVIELAWISMGLEEVDGKVRGKDVIKGSSLIDPERRIGAHITKITSIRQEDVEGQPVFGLCQAQRELWIEAKGAFIVGHNVDFDWRFLCEEWAQAGLMPPVIAGTFDTMAVARVLWPGRKNSLADVCERMKIPLEAHRAPADCSATARVFLKMMRRGL